MKGSVKAALISGLVFPGLGHLVLRKYIVGLVLLCLAGWSSFALISATIDIAHQTIEEIERSGMVIGPDLIAQLLARSPQNIEQTTRVPVCLFIACWIVGVVDSYRIGKKEEGRNKSSVIEKN